TAGAGDVERLPQRRFDQHVGGRLGAAALLAAHDASKRFHPGLVGDDAHVLIEKIGPAVERGQNLARSRTAHDEVAADLSRVEYMQWPVAVVGEEIGDVDQGVDRPEPDRAEALL